MNFNTNTSDQKELFKDIIERLRPPLGEKSAYPDHTGEYWALCPFHDEEQVGSFSFNEQGFNCHMCGINGSIFELGQKLGIIKDFKITQEQIHWDHSSGLF